MKDKKFVIIDAMALAYKAYYAFISRPLISSKGEPTSAVYGFISQILKILEVHKPDYIAVAFDSPYKTFRHEKYENYKSSRQEMPDDMKPQIDRIKQVIEILKIPIYILSRYEADDIIGTAAKHAESAGLLTFVVTPDKDFNQMITDRVRIVRPGKTTDEIIIWDAKKDNVVLIEDAWIELSAAHFVPNTKLTASDYKEMGNALLLSTLLPGLGNSKLAGGNNAWLVGIVGYSCLGGGIAMISNSKTQYSKYKLATETLNRSSFYEQATSSALTGKVLLISAGAIWICDLIITGFQVRPSETITALQKRVSIGYSYDVAMKKPVFMLQYKF